MERTQRKQPGDLILDRYMPNATQEAREAARANLYALIELMLEFERQNTDGPAADSQQG